MAEWYRNYGSWIVGTLLDLCFVAGPAILIWALLRSVTKWQVRYWIVFSALLACVIVAMLVYGEIY